MSANLIWSRFAHTITRCGLVTRCHANSRVHICTHMSIHHICINTHVWCMVYAVVRERVAFLTHMHTKCSCSCSRNCNCNFCVRVCESLRVWVYVSMRVCCVYAGVLCYVVCDVVGVGAFESESMYVKRWIINMCFNKNDKDRVYI